MNNEKYKVSDFVSNMTQDMIHMCKRKNNNKRDFLFVNSHQGKHVPVSPSKVYDLVDKLYKLSYLELADKKNILVVGFAETATALGELFFDRCMNEYGSVGPLDVVGYVTTTREEWIVPNAKRVDFSEAHSHAACQHIYLNEKVDVETIVFVEDEITTGNTILDLIERLSFFNYKGIKNCYVVSVCNWQTDEYKVKFENKNVKAISLFQGQLQNIESKLDVTESDLTYYFVDGLIIDKTFLRMSDTVKTMISTDKMRLNNKLVIEVVDILENKYNYNNTEVIEVVGTEEFMGIPLKIAKELENRGYTVYFHATTRSPITISDETIITDGVKLRSAYDKDRETYLYNLNTINPDRVLVLVEKLASEGFIEDIGKVYNSQNVNNKRKDTIIMEL